MFKKNIFRYIYVCIGCLITTYQATSQVDTALKSTVPGIISTQTKFPPAKAAIIPGKYYQDFYKDNTTFQKYQVPGYKTTATSGKKDAHPVINIVGSVLLGILGEKTNHPYYGPNN